MQISRLARGGLGYLFAAGVVITTTVILFALRSARITNGSQSSLVRSGPLQIDLAWHTVTRDGQELKLTATEFNLLAYLAANRGRVLTHRSILEHVWGPADADHTEYLRVYMRQLRKKLEPDPEHPQIIVTEPGVGYRFLADE
ncbi:MAG TPA: response regulator transcription factor [Anaerolineales bacterium]|nr:response regulator transcription factor [Anaerolineales bacterium]